MVLHEVEEGDEDACAAGADGMTEGDGAAALVETGPVKAEQMGAAEGLDGEGLIDLDGIHLVEVPAGATADTADGFDRAEAHEGGIAADDGAGDDAGAGGELVGGEGVVAGEQDESGAVVDAGGVAGGDAAVFAEGGFQFGEGLDGGIGSRVLVLADGGAIGSGNGDDLAGEGGAVRGGEALAAGGESVLFGTGDAELVGDALGGLAHANVEHGIAEAVEEEGVLQGDGAELFAPAGVEGVMRCAAHHLDTAGEDEIVFAQADGVGGEGDGFEGGAAGHVDGVAGGGLGQAKLPASLAGDVHAAAGLEDLAENDLFDVRAEGFGSDRAGDGVGEIGGREGFEPAAEAADGGTVRGDDVDGAHGGDCWCEGFSRLWMWRRCRDGFLIGSSLDTSLEGGVVPALAVVEDGVGLPEVLGFEAAVGL